MSAPAAGISAEAAAFLSASGAKLLQMKAVSLVFPEGAVLRPSWAFGLALAHSTTGRLKTTSVNYVPAALRPVAGRASSLGSSVTTIPPLTPR